MKTKRRRERMPDGPPRKDDGMGTMLVICTKLGGCYNIPREYVVDDCRWCGEPVWISSDNEATAKWLGLKVMPVCSDCLKQV